MENTYITLTEENVDEEHICCAIGNKLSKEGYAAKKALIAKRLTDGLTFTKLNVRGKVFIEYVPAEHAWAPVTAKNYLFIHCFWVSGKYKGHGHGKALITKCLDDAKAKGKAGVCVLVGDKARGFLNDKKFLVKAGFTLADTAPPYFELLAYRFNEATPLPTINACAKKGAHANEEGVTFFYSALCPFTYHYVEEMASVCKDEGIPVTKVEFTTKKAAQASPTPFTVFSVFYNGTFLTHEIMTKKKFLKTLTAQQG